MLQIISPDQASKWNYFDERLGKGFVANNKDGLVMQVQNAYIASNIAFYAQEIQAKVDDFMCRNGLAAAGNCRERIEGLGDLVHIVVSPIAKMIDVLAGTQIADCGGCAARRNAMNKAVPL